VSLQALQCEEEEHLTWTFHSLFTPHYDTLKVQLFPKRNITNTDNRPELECWSADKKVINELLQILPFSTLLTQGQYENLTVDSLDNILYQSRQQLLYWHLDQHIDRGQPLDTLVLTEEDDYLWRNHIPS